MDGRLREKRYEKKRREEFLFKEMKENLKIKKKFKQCKKCGRSVKEDWYYFHRYCSKCVAKCANCGRVIRFSQKYCQECLEELNQKLKER